MKRQNKIYLALFAGFPLVSIGQTAPILTTNDLPKVGQTYVMKSVDSSVALGVMAGSSGANLNWNFSMVDTGKFGHEDTLTFFNPVGSPLQLMFPDASLGVLHHNGENNHPHVGLYKTDSNGMLIVGFAESDTIKLDHYAYEYPLLKYNASIYSYANAKHDIKSADTYVKTWVYLNSIADAWGKITTPAGTVNAVRIYTKEVYIDSEYRAGSAVESVRDSSGYSYKWYTNGIGVPYFSISKSHLDDPDKIQVIYADTVISTTPTAINNIKSKVFISMFPNPVNDRINIHCFQDLTFRLYDIMGKLIIQNHYSSGINSIERNNLPAGFYTYIASNPTGQIQSGKIILK